MLPSVLTHQQYHSSLWIANKALCYRFPVHRLPIAHCLLRWYSWMSQLPAPASCPPFGGGAECFNRPRADGWVATKHERFKTSITLFMPRTRISLNRAVALKMGKPRAVTSGYRGLNNIQKGYKAQKEWWQLLDVKCIRRHYLKNKIWNRIGIYILFLIIRVNCFRKWCQSPSLSLLLQVS